jgi:cell division topological specificity factor
MDFFNDIYHKLVGFFRHTEGQQPNAKDVARNRLRVVLMQDRTNLNPELLERMRVDLVKLLSKYLEMDKEALELNLEQDGDQMALMLSIPVIRAKDEEEIKKATAPKKRKPKTAAATDDAPKPKKKRRKKSAKAG